MDEKMKNIEEIAEEQTETSEVVEETAEVVAEEFENQAEETEDVAAEESEELVEAYVEDEAELGGKEIKKKSSVVKWCLGVFAAILVIAAIVLGTISHFSQLKEIKRLQSRVDDLELVMQHLVFGEEVSVVADYVEEQLKLMK